MQRTLYVTDLDGTLLNTKDRISEESLQMINLLIEEGMLFTYATARSLVSATVVTRGLHTNIPVIAYNGALIIDANTKQVLAQESFTEEETAYIVSVLQTLQISPLVYAYRDGEEKVTWIPRKENEGIRRYLSLRQGDQRLNPVNDEKQLYLGNMFYFTCIGEEEALLPVYEAFKEDDRFRCTFQQELYRTEYWCEIMPVKATKAEAIKKLKALWQCDQVISFGDAINDVPMFQISDASYAVANAVPELKALASGIIDSNEEDGVAKWLFRHSNVTRHDKKQTVR